MSALFASISRTADHCIETYIQHTSGGQSIIEVVAIGISLEQVRFEHGFANELAWGEM